MMGEWTHGSGVYSIKHYTFVNYELEVWPNWDDNLLLKLGHFSNFGYSDVNNKKKDS